MAYADTNDWDTVNACRFTDVNTAIVAGNSSPASFAYTDVESGVTQGVVNGTFGAWQLVEGGDGKNVHMSIPVTDGQCVLYNNGQPQDTYTYAGKAIVEVNLTYIPQPDGENGTPNNLQVSTTQTDPEDPIVAVLSFDFSESTLPSYLQGYVKDCLAAWLTENLELFNNVFAVVNLNMLADTGSFQWLKPTYLGYAVTDNGSLDTSVFGVLAMTEGRTNLKLAHQISPNAIPDGANVGFLIAPERFLEKVLLPGVYLMFKDADPSDFTVTNDGIQVSNINALNFQDLELENGTVKPASIGANNFTITLQGTQLILNFTDIMIDYEWGVTVHVDYKETTEAALDGSNHFQLNTVSYPVTNTTIVISSGRQWVDFGAEFFLSVAGVIVGSVIGAAVEAALATEEAVEGATEALSESLEEGILESETEALMPEVDGTGYETFNDPEMIQTEADDSSVEMNSANEGNSSATQKAKGFLARNKVKILGSIVGGIAGVTAGDIPKILENMALDNTQDIPTLDTFAEESIDSVTWPYITGYQLTSAQFNGSFQMGLTFTVAD